MFPHVIHLIESNAFVYILLKSIVFNRHLRRETEELKKIKSGMSDVILKDLKEHAKYRKWKQLHIDPRNASRTPSASKELMYRLRYESPVGASPSRHLDHQKPFYDDDPTFDRSNSFRGSVGRSFGTTPSFNGKFSPLHSNNICRHWYNGDSVPFREIFAELPPKLYFFY